MSRVARPRTGGHEHAGRDAHGCRQVAVLSVTRVAIARPYRGRLAAHCPHEGPVRRHARAGRRCRAAEQRDPFTTSKLTGCPRRLARERGIETGGGEKSGSGRGKATDRTSSRKGGKAGGQASASRSAEARSASARKGAATRKAQRLSQLNACRRRLVAHMTASPAPSQSIAEVSRNQGAALRDATHCLSGAAQQRIGRRQGASARAVGARPSASVAFSNASGSYNGEAGRSSPLMTVLSQSSTLDNQ